MFLLNVINVVAKQDLEFFYDKLTDESIDFLGGVWGQIPLQNNIYYNKFHLFDWVGQVEWQNFLLMELISSILFSCATFSHEVNYSLHSISEWCMYLSRSRARKTPAEADVFHFHFTSHYITLFTLHISAGLSTFRQQKHGTYFCVEAVLWQGLEPGAGNEPHFSIIKRDSPWCLKKPVFMQWRIFPWLDDLNPSSCCAYE